MIIRNADLNDVTQILSVYRELFDTVSDLEPEFFRKADQEQSFIEDIISNPNAEIILAVEDDKVLGFVLLNIQYAPPYNVFIPQRYLYIMDIAVRQGARNKGIGKKLLSASEDWARVRNINKLELSVLLNNTNARTLYEKYGYRAYIQTMVKYLEK